MISVGIAAYNEEKTIEKVIGLWLKEPIDEIFIVSDSTDKTNEIIEKIAKKNKKIKILVRESRLGKPSAINEILRRCKGNIIIMTDADLYPEPGCTKKLCKWFKNKEVGLIAGRPVLLKSSGMISFWSKISFDIIHKKRLKDIGLNVTGNLYGVRKGVVKKIPEDVMLDDSYVALMVKKRGYKIVYESMARVYVRGPKNIRDFVTQKSRTRAGWYQILKNEKIKTNRSLLCEIRTSLPSTLRKLFSLKGFLYLPPFYFFSLVVWLNGWWIWKRNKDLIKVWKVAKTTK